MSTLNLDITYAARMLRRRWGSAVPIVTAIAVGVGGAALAGSFAVQIDLAPLPYRDLGGLVTILETESVRCPGCMDLVTYDRVRAWTAADPRSVQDLSVILAGQGVLQRAGENTPVSIASVSDGFFRTLGVTPVRGTTAGVSEEPNVAAISYDEWQRSFGGEAGTIGRTITVDDRKYVVGAVLPRGFAYPRGTRVWVRLDPNALANEREAPAFELVGRLRTGYTAPQVAQELTAIRSVSEAGLPDDHRRGAFVNPLESELRETTSTSLRAIIGAVALIFLIACASAAGLVISGLIDRRNDFAIRHAMGARHGDILRPILAEVCLLVGGSGLLGIAGALALAPYVSTVFQAQLKVPIWFSVTPAVVLLGVVLTIIATVLVAVTAIHAIRGIEAIHVAREAGANATASRQSVFVRRVLAGVQLGVSALLLTSAALLAKSYERGRSANLGYRTDSLYVTDIPLDTATRESPVVSLAFAADITQRLAASHGWGNVSVWGSVRPWLGNNAETIVLDADRQATTYPIESYDVQPNFFDFFGYRLVEGRAFSGADDAGSAPIAIINDYAAQRLWPGENPIGKRFRFGPRGATHPWMTVVGVASNSQPIANVANGLAAYSATHFFALMWRPLAQTSPTHLRVGVRAGPAHVPAIDGLHVFPANMRKEVPAFQLMVDQNLDGSEFAAARANSELLGSWSVYGIALALFGVAALARDAVKRRNREIGIRMALGADAVRIAGMFLRDAFVLSTCSISAALALGFLGRAWLGQILFRQTEMDRSGLLVGMSVADPIVLLVGGALVACAVVATLGPSILATRVDPAVATRSL